jgi:hypothetical protein
MKTAAIVILFPVMSVVIVSLYVHGAASRIVALVLLVAGVIGVLAGFLKDEQHVRTVLKLLGRIADNSM